MPSTRPFIPRVTLVFDFDRTLAGDTTDAVLARYGIGRPEWKERFLDPLGDDWDDIIKRGQALVDLGRAKGRPLGRDLLQNAAAEVALFDGVLDMPDRLRRAAREVYGRVEVEFIVLSSGYSEVIAPTEIARRFDRVFASGLHFRNGEAVCVKRIITHPEKALYLDAIGKAGDVAGANAPGMAGRPIDEHERHVVRPDGICRRRGIRPAGVRLSRRRGGHCARHREGCGVGA